MQNWKNCGKTHGYKHHGPNRSPLRKSEFWRCGESSCSRSNRCDHSPIHPDHSYIFVEAIIDARNEAAPDQNDNTEIIKLVSPFYNFDRMIGDGMVGCAHTQTTCCAEKKTTKYKHILFRCGLITRCQNLIQDCRRHDTDNSTNKVSVDVDCLVMEISKTVGD